MNLLKNTMLVAVVTLLGTMPSAHAQVKLKGVHNFEMVCDPIYTDDAESGRTEFFQLRLEDAQFSNKAASSGNQMAIIGIEDESYPSFLTVSGKYKITGNHFAFNFQTQGLKLTVDGEKRGETGFTAVNVKMLVQAADGTWELDTVGTTKCTMIHQAEGGHVGGKNK